jgi:molybdopterin/thiamine biosynthesis adenylyltransferase
MPFYPEHIGRPKVECWKRHLLSLNPECAVTTHQKAVTRHDGPWLEQALSGVRLLFLAPRIRRRTLLSVALPRAWAYA